eukprot:scaffold81484_cov31-Tisochrysis_lutea.AAC.11
MSRACKRVGKRASRRRRARTVFSPSKEASNSTRLRSTRPWARSTGAPAPAASSSCMRAASASMSWQSRLRHPHEVAAPDSTARGRYDSISASAICSPDESLASQHPGSARRNSNALPASRTSGDGTQSKSSHSQLRSADG